MTASHPIAEILPAWLASADPWTAVPLSLFLFGLAGGFAHCTAMCGPFVMVQVGASLADRPLAQYGMLARLKSGLLPMYHLGRTTTYAILGSVAAGLSGLASSVLGGRWIMVFGLGAAAILFAAVAFGGWRPKGAPFGRWVTAAVAPVSRLSGSAPMAYAVGLLLGLLPCHLVYAALAASSVLSDPLGGALSMLSFSAGTSLGLVCLGSFGAIAGSRFRGAARRLLPVAGLANVLLLAGLAVRLASGTWSG